MNLCIEEKDIRVSDLRSGDLVVTLVPDLKSEGPPIETVREVDWIGKTGTRGMRRIYFKDGTEGDLRTRAVVRIKIVKEFVV